LGIICAHFCLVVAKIYFLGLFSVIFDVAGFVVLWVAIARYDYCLTIVFAVLNLLETFSIIIILGYYLQTNMGKNVPGKDQDDTPGVSSGDDDDDKKSRGFGLVQRESRRHKPILLRSFFDDLLRF